MIKHLISTIQLYFRFIDGCQSPGDVSGVLAWTDRRSSVRVSGVDSGSKNGEEELFVNYRTHDGRLKREWVSVRNLDVCPPRTSDKVLVVRGPEIGRIYPAARFERNTMKEKIGIVVRRGTGRAKEYKTYSFTDVTRTSEYE